MSEAPIYQSLRGHLATLRLARFACLPSGRVRESV